MCGREAWWTIIDMGIWLDNIPPIRQSQNGSNHTTGPNGTHNIRETKEQSETLDTYPQLCICGYISLAEIHSGQSRSSAKDLLIQVRFLHLYILFRISINRNGTSIPLTSKGALNRPLLFPFPSFLWLLRLYATEFLPPLPTFVKDHH